MIGRDGRDGPEWPIEDTAADSRDADATSERPGREARFGGEYERDARFAEDRGSPRERRLYPDREPARGDATTEVRRRGIDPLWLALGAVVLLLLLAWFFTANRNPDQDKLTTNQPSATKSAATDPNKRCASQATYDLIKRELFRRAAQTRGSDQAAFDRLSGYAVLRMENPVLESDGNDAKAASCSGTLSLDLPPGVAVVGGRRTLTADVDYTIQRAADDSGDVVLLRNADAIIAPLATLARTPAPAEAAPSTPQPIPAPAPGTTDVTPVQPAPAPVAPPRSAPVAPPRPASTRPSFKCANARTRGEIAVCGDAGLAALDRNMAAQYVRSMAAASPAQQALLRRTRDRFLAFRDGCPNKSCMGDAYVGRMREIRDIMEDRWQPR